jgi:hypothetical protein
VAWLNLIGLALDIIGAAILSYGLFLNRTEAIELGTSRMSGDTEEENLQLPAVRDRLRQSRNAKIGLCLLVTGFALQMASSWP